MAARIVSEIDTPSARATARISAANSGGSRRLINIVAALIWSAILAVKKEAILVDASVQSADMSVEEVGEIWDWMRKEKAFAVIRPLQRGELIRVLAEQARSPQEIRPMAVAVAQLSVIFDHDALWLAPRFDQLLRLYDKPLLTPKKPRPAGHLDQAVGGIL
jgi:hypothetical protein